MKNLTLKPTQRADVASAIEIDGFRASQFEWIEVDSNYLKNAKVSELQFVGTDYYFRFDDSRDDHVCEFSPGAERRHETRHLETWNLTYVSVRQWLNILRTEVDTIDPWEAIAEEKAILELASKGVDNEPFSDEEQVKALSALKEIENYLTTVHGIESEIVKPKMDYLAGATERLGKTDWMNVGISTVISIILNATVSPESARDIMRFLSGIFQTIFGDSLGLLGP